MGNMHNYGAMFPSTFPVRKHGDYRFLRVTKCEVYMYVRKGCRTMVPSIFPVVIPTQIPYAHGMCNITISTCIMIIGIYVTVHEKIDHNAAKTAWICTHLSISFYCIK